MFSFEDIRKIVGENIVKVLEEEYDLRTIMLEANLFDIGMESLSYMNLIVKLEIIFDIEFEDDILNMEKYNSVNKISNYVQNMINIKD